METVLAELGEKLPCLQCLLRPEYVPYLSTGGTVLLGWMIVCWLLNVVWTFLAPLVISILGVIIVCPTTAKWCLRQFSPSIEIALRDLVEKLPLSLPEVK